MIGLVFFFNSALSFICIRSYGFIHTPSFKSALALSETKILANQHIGATKILNSAL